jgi:acetolactate synthase small subunit
MLPSGCSVSFLLAAEAAPGVLPRLLQPFARRDLTPDRVACQRTGEMLQVEIAVDAVPAEMVHLIEGNLLQVVGVHRVSRIAMRAAA